VAVPVPPRLTAALPLLALLARVSVALRLPVAVGAKPSTRVQLPPAATGVAVLQVPARLKSPGAVPPSVRPVKASAAEPLLLTVTICVAPAVPTTCEPKFSAVALIEMAAAGAALPVPLSATVVGELAALWLMLSVALRAPAAAGAKLTSTVHELLAATLPPAAQVPPLASAKSPGLVPLSAKLVRLSGAVPVLLSVSVWVALVLPTVVAGRVRADDEIDATGLVLAVPVPLSAMATGVSVLLWVMLSVPLRVPAAVGVKATKMVQLEPTFTVVPQVPPLRAKSPVLATVNPLIERPVRKLAYTVTVLVAVVLPTAVLAKASDVGVLPR
jgi:hypothetical protein